MTNAATPTARHVAIALYVSAGVIAFVAAGLLALSASDSRSLRGSDLAWILVAAVPAGVTAVLAASAAFGCRRPGPGDRGRGTTTLTGGAVLTLLNLLGGAWVMLLISGNDAKWVCAFAGAIGALAALLTAGGGVALRRGTRSKTG